MKCYIIEPEPDYVDCLQPTLKRPDYWKNVGSSKNRTRAHEEDSRRLMEKVPDHIHTMLIKECKKSLLNPILLFVQENH